MVKKREGQQLQALMATTRFESVALLCLSELSFFFLSFWIENAIFRQLCAVGPSKILPLFPLTATEFLRHGPDRC